LNKVLIITYYWPPTGGPGVLRWLKFVKYLPQFGWKPYVYTPSNPQAFVTDNSLEKDIPKEAEILKTKITEPHNLFFFFNNKNKSVAPGFLQEQKSQSTFLNFAKWVRGNLFIPDPRVWWVKPSVSYLEKIIKKENIKVVISTGPPHSMHLIGMKLKQKTGVKWIADFRDPWTGIDFYRQLNVTSWADKRHKKLEHQVLKNADMVLAVGETLKNELIELGAKKSVVITNGFDGDDFKNLSKNKENSDKTTITYTGSLNGDRNPVAFWEALAKLNNTYPNLKNLLQIKLIGTVDYRVKESISNLGLNELVNYVSPMPYNQSLQEQKNADILLLVVNNTPNAKGILTGKFFEYLSSGNYILAIGPEDGDVAAILKESYAGEIFDYHQSDKIFNTLESLIIQKTKNLNSDSEKVNMFERKNLSQKLSHYLNELINN
jgi:glycosyltransferase involved in cell wall biosynthesis